MDEHPEFGNALKRLRGDRSQVEVAKRGRSTTAITITLVLEGFYVPPA